MAMTLSLVLTINNRSPEVSEQVADSLALPGNAPDELVVVLDRPTAEARRGAAEAYGKLDIPTKYVYIPGEPGWLGPARAWNAGFKAATGDLIYCISSEVVQDAHNVEKARAICQNGDTVVFGACHNSEPTNLVVGAEPGLLVSSKMPRPLGFIVCMPKKQIDDIGGFDEEFMRGFWYDDDDFFLRMWQTGVRFVFSDDIHGIHLDHSRPDLDTVAGQEGIRRNQTHMYEKHGKFYRWNDLLRQETRSEGKLVWEHV